MNDFYKKALVPNGASAFWQCVQLRVISLNDALNDGYTELLVVGNSAVQLFHGKYMRRYMVEK